jgi:hypothetical protein
VGLIGAVTGCGGEVTDDAARGSAAGGAGQVAVHGGRGPIGGRSATGGVTGSGGNSSSGGLGPTGGAGGAADVCGAILEGLAIPCYPVLEVVIDIAGSMADKAYPGTNDPTSKWDALKSILFPVFQSVNSGWAVGIEYSNLIVPSPLPNPPVCYEGQPAVPIAPMTDAQKSAIDASIDSITTSSTPWRLGGYAPTLAAWRHALAEVSSFVDPRCAQGPRYIMLITDGVPSVGNDGCTIEQPLSQAEYEAFVDILRTEGQSVKVETLVVGVPGSQDAQGADYDPRFYLSQLAIAGGIALPGCTSSPGTLESDGTYQNGTYCHFDLVENPDLSTSLFTTFGDTGPPIPCEFSLGWPPTDGRTADYWSLQITFTPSGGPSTILTRASDSSCTDGQWYVSSIDVDGNPEVARLCPDFCTMLQCAPNAVFRLTLGCA